MSTSFATHRRPAVFSSFPELIATESTRHGGVSKAPYASLNLGLFTSDDMRAIAENRRRFFASLGLTESRVAGAHQVHGDSICYATAPKQVEGYDALITDQRNLFLTVTVADCTPILIYDAQTPAVAAVHAGWRGTVAGITRKTLENMDIRFGTDPGNCFAYIGTCIDECSFEVDTDVADHFSAAFKRWEEERHKFFIDLKAANRQQLIDAGVPPQQIEVSLYSTVLHNEDYFSYRKENGQTGRMLGLIGLQ